MNTVSQILGSAAFLIAHCTCISALEVTRGLDIAAPPAAVWAIMSDFCAIERWHPQVKRCFLSEDEEDRAAALPVRGLITTDDGSVIVEAETDRDEGSMSYSSRLLGGPVPVKNYSSTIAVTSKGAGALVTWRASFEADAVSDADAVTFIAGSYERGLAGIAKEAGRSEGGRYGSPLSLLLNHVWRDCSHAEPLAAAPRDVPSLRHPHRACDREPLPKDPDDRVHRREVPHVVFHRCLRRSGARRGLKEPVSTRSLPLPSSQPAGG